mmetsp:Transcript_101918/g.297211  ORF Transcript_101918/g.297211 Transcript_101918/m.297211 type:complete len:249 (-) Transcript_101918:27-773(-)
MKRSVRRKVSWLGTSRRIRSATLKPFMHRTLFSSMFLSTSSSFTTSSGFSPSDNGLASRANKRSMQTLRILSLMMGVYASGMGTHSVTCSCWFSFSTKELKKSSRRTLGGPMQSVSMSLPGCTTPSLYDPRVVIFTLDLTSSSVMPASMPRFTIHSVTINSISRSTSCRRPMPSGVSAGNSPSSSLFICSLRAWSASEGSCSDIGSATPYFTGGPVLGAGGAGPCCGAGPELIRTVAVRSGPPRRALP